MFARSLCALVVLFAGAAGAQQGGEYNLNGGVVHFRAPADWTMIMQKSEGDPQVVAFTVKDPADEGTDEATRVSVTTRKLDDGAAFQAFVNASLDKARQAAGYEQDKEGGEGSSLRYYAQEGKARYHYRETYYFRSGVGVQLRCVRPVLAKTSPQWIAAFDHGCDLIADSLK